MSAVDLPNLVMQFGKYKGKAFKDIPDYYWLWFNERNPHGLIAEYIQKFILSNMNNTFHVHEDIEEAAKWYKIPLALYSNYDVYIMQEDRCVFVGSGESAISWMKRNEGKYRKSRFPLNGL